MYYLSALFLPGISDYHGGASDLLISMLLFAPKGRVNNLLYNPVGYISALRGCATLECLTIDSLDGSH